MLFLVGIVVTVTVYLLRVGIEYICYKVARKEKAALSDTFYAFKNRPGRFLLLFLLYFLIMLLAFIPYVILAVIGMIAYITSGNIAPFIVCIAIGVVITIALSYFLLLRYSLVNFLIFDNPEMSAIEAMKKSAKLMDGHKLRMLRLALSFIGIIMLSILTCGIASLWLLPYQYVSYSFFYMELVHPAKMKPDWRPFISDAGEALVRKKVFLEKY